MGSDGCAHGIDFINFQQQINSAKISQRGPHLAISPTHPNIHWDPTKKFQAMVWGGWGRPTQKGTVVPCSGSKIDRKSRYLPNKEILSIYGSSPLWIRKIRVLETLRDQAPVNRRPQICGLFQQILSVVNPFMDCSSKWMVKESWEVPPWLSPAGTATICAWLAAGLTTCDFLIPTHRNNPWRDSLHLRSAGIIHRFGAFYSLVLGLSISLTIHRTNLWMGFAMLKKCWNNPQIWGLLSPTWSHQDGTKSLPSSLHPLSPIHRPPSFPKVSLHDSHPHHQSYFLRVPYSFLKI